MKTLRLTWAIYPVKMLEGPGESLIPSRKIELVARAGAIARRVSRQEQTSVSYATAMQRRCQGPPFDGARVAELYMNGGGNIVLAVEKQNEQLVLVEEHSSDGLCEPAPCPVERSTVARIPIPPGVVTEERFHVVEGGGEHDESCP